MIMLEITLSASDSSKVDDMRDADSDENMLEPSRALL
jgi:hypothetical protein